MATRAYTVTQITAFGDFRCHVIQWTGLLNGDDGAPIEMSGSADRSAHALGTFGASGNLKIEGSNDPGATPTNWATLNNPQGTALDLTGASIKAVLESTHFIRPRASAGDGTTNLTCQLFVRRLG